MKKLFFCIWISLCACGAPTTSPEAIQADEETWVSSFYHASDFRLSEFKKVDVREGLAVYSNLQAHKYVILADSGLMDLLHANRVLAFSTSSAWGQDGDLPKILDYYEKMLHHLLVSHKPIVTHKTPAYKPLLTAQWGQGEPYNAYCPIVGGKTSMAGCLPVAMAQLVNYFQPKEYPDSSKLIAKIGKEMEAQYGPLNTVASTHQVKDVLVHQYGFSPACRLRVGLRTSQLLELVERNLAQGHMLLLSNRDHAFLCDGMEDEFLHLNMGYTTNYSGYYRLLYTEDEKYDEQFATSVFSDIFPSNSLTKSLVVVKPGTLGQLLGKDSLSVGTLSLSGTLNGKDVALLRKMAGAIDESTSAIGALTQLDLKDVNYVNGDVYAVEDAAKNGFVVRRNKKNYNFREMTEGKWKVFCAQGFDKTKDYFIEKQGDRFFVKFILSASPNPLFLFMDCENLNF